MGMRSRYSNAMDEPEELARFSKGDRGVPCGTAGMYKVPECYTDSGLGQALWQLMACGWLLGWILKNSWRL